MAQSRSALVFFVAVVLTVSFAILPEDVPETTYDESEPLAYAGCPVVSIAKPEAAAPAPPARKRISVLRVAHLRLDRCGFNCWEGRAYSICEFLTILDHSLRC